MTGDKLMVAGIDEHLRAFNRKERYWLLTNAVGENFKALDRSFLERIENVLAATGKSVVIPGNAWFAIDYHFDWIYGAILKYSESVSGVASEKPIPRRKVIGAEGGFDVVGNQEDVDLLVAFGRTLILIEAKFDGGWNDKQFSRKNARFADLKVFQSEILADLAYAALDIHFIRTSVLDPSAHQRSKTHLPNHEVPWMPLICDEGKFLRVQRCKLGPKQKPQPSNEGPDWQIIGGPFKMKQSSDQTGD